MGYYNSLIDIRYIESVVGHGTSKLQSSRLYIKQPIHTTNNEESKQRGFFVRERQAWTCKTSPVMPFVCVPLLWAS